MDIRRAIKEIKKGGEKGTAGGTITLEVLKGSWQQV